MASALNLAEPAATVGLIHAIVSLSCLPSDKDRLDPGVQPFMAVFVEQKTIAE